MSITLTYPIRETHENLALKKDQTVVAYYVFQTLPSRLRMMKKRANTKLLLLK